MAVFTNMTTEEVLEAVAALPQEEWPKIQCGIAELMVAQFSGDEVAEITRALAESEAEFERGEGISEAELRREFGL